MHERLFVCVPPSHELAQQESLTFADINGFHFLLRTELGFWDTLCSEFRHFFSGNPGRTVL